MTSIKITDNRTVKNSNGSFGNDKPAIDRFKDMTPEQRRRALERAAEAKRRAEQAQRDREKGLLAKIEEKTKEVKESPATIATKGRVLELLAAGNFTRRLTWKEKRALKKLNIATERVRDVLGYAFSADALFMREALAHLAHIETAARLELLSVLPVDKSEDDEGDDE